MIRKEITTFNTDIFKEFPQKALLTAGDLENRNTMTVSWGLMGTLWYKNVIVVFVRKNRHTFHLMEESSHFTLSFMKDGYEKDIMFMGKNSGKDMNKYEHTNLVPVYDNDSFVSYMKDSKYVLKCKKLYSAPFEEQYFIDKSLLNLYKEDLSDLHQVYVAEVTSLLVDEDYIE